ncbi:MAG TPA: glycosyltransferase [Pyrinomonadaceae bacterium]|nr:glycosyltransferase [Pyrinomonadaceae bacterium]
MKLSVCLVTFNHEKFVAQALDSVLEQQVTFDYEIVVSDDCSTDKTRQIIASYQQRHPEKIRLVSPEENLGVNRNFAQTIKACRGEYIAILEGDDFWTSAKKLQEQVEFLEAHPECVICFHSVKVVYENGESASRITPSLNHKKMSTIEDLLGIGNFIPTCSVVFKSGLFGEFPDWFYTLRIADFPLHVLNAQYGKIGYINKVMGAYRVHRGGTFSAESTARNTHEVVRGYNYLDAELNYKYHDTIEGICGYWQAVEYYRNGEIAKAQACAAKRVGVAPFNTQAAMAWLLTHSAPLYRLVKTLRRSSA